MKILVTGCAGFIGSHTCEYLLKRGDTILGIDNINDYYDVERKKENLEVLKKYENFEFRREDIRTTKVIEEWKPEKICHLASMAGVRYSIEHPEVYVDVNINGFINILEQARKVGVKQIAYASSSSVYGLNKKIPFSETDTIETPNSPYACSKMAMELYAKTYHQLYNLNMIGLRFFTVYGPRGRPDMAPYKFLKAIKDGTKFYKYGDGTSSRDYTYVSDIVSGVVASIDNKREVKCEVYNLGNSSPVTLNEFIELCEKVVGKNANYDQIGNQLGDVPHTYANISKAKRDLDYEPKVKLEDGLRLMYVKL
jgi:UDP-glucuronate 4-epimerase